MTGVFIRKKNGSIWCLICGLFLVGLFLFLNFADSGEINNSYVGIIFGGVITFFSVMSLFFNYKAFFVIDDDRILSKYHWFGKLDCIIAEVAYAQAQVNTLTILLKNGKRHVIMGIDNPRPLSDAIRRQIFSVEAESPDKLRNELATTQAARKKELYRMFGSIALMLVYIILAVLLTGGRDMCDFSTLDWTIFGVMCAIEVLTVAATFYFAGRCGKYLLPIERLKYRLRGAIIATQPLPGSNVREVYTDENHLGRIVVCGFPNDEDVYCCVQEFTGNLNLETVHTSEIYASDNDRLAETLLPLIDITHQFVQKAE